jgi:hypothetical protein
LEARLYELLAPAEDANLVENAEMTHGFYSSWLLSFRVFGPKRDEETGGLRKPRNGELHNLIMSRRM